MATLQRPQRWHILQLFVQYVLVAYVLTKKLFFKTLRLVGIRVKPKCNVWWFDGLAAPCAAIRRYASAKQTALALGEVIYDWPNKKPQNFREWLANWWIGGMTIARGVNNRLDIVEHLLEHEIRRVWNDNGQQKVKVVFLAGGLVPAGITVAAKLDREDIQLACWVLDISKSALDRAYRKAFAAGVAHFFTFERVNLLRFDDVVQYLKPIQPDIVELIGLVDYFPKYLVIKLLDSVHKVMPHKALLLTGNVLWKAIVEAPFLHFVVDWRPFMFYRSVSGFRKILYQAGFIPEDGMSIVEPCGNFLIYAVRAAIPAESAAAEEFASGISVETVA